MFSFGRDLYNHKDYKSNYVLICDLKLSSAMGYRIDVISYVEHLRKLTWDSGCKKIGFIVGSINQIFLIENFIVLVKDLNFDVEMFENTELCLKWVSDESDIRNKIDSSINFNRSMLNDQFKAEILN